MVQKKVSYNWLQLYRKTNERKIDYTEFNSSRFLYDDYGKETTLLFITWS